MTKLGNTLALGLVAAFLLAAAGCDGTAGPSTGLPAAPEAKPDPAAVTTMVHPTKTAAMPIGQKNFVVDWVVLGPFKFKAEDFKGDQQQEATDHLFMKDEAALNGTQPAPTGTTWQTKHFKPASAGKAGQVDLDGLYGQPEYACAYAVAWIDCPQAMDNVKLAVGSDDYIKVWINGKCVHTYGKIRRASEWDQDIVPNISLKKGLNRVVVKCVDVVFDWDFYLRFTDAADKPIEFAPPKS